MQVAVLTGLGAAPWVVKPLYGFISDTIPIFGYRRRSYLIICGILGEAACLSSDLLLRQQDNCSLMQLIQQKNFLKQCYAAPEETAHRQLHLPQSHHHLQQAELHGCKAVHGVATTLTGGLRSSICCVSITAGQIPTLSTWLGPKIMYSFMADFHRSGALLMIPWVSGTLHNLWACVHREVQCKWLTMSAVPSASAQRALSREGLHPCCRCSVVAGHVSSCEQLQLRMRHAGGGLPWDSLQRCRGGLNCCGTLPWGSSGGL